MLLYPQTARFWPGSAATGEHPEMLIDNRDVPQAGLPHHIKQIAAIDSMPIDTAMPTAAARNTMLASASVITAAGRHLDRQHREAVGIVLVLQ